MVEEMLALRGVTVGPEIATRIRPRRLARGDEWHLDEVVISSAGKRHHLWRTVGRDGFVLNVLVQRRRDMTAAKRLLRKLLKRWGGHPG
ncbi:transposase-like protein [Azospirillum soli]|nr:transposase-like protein [Azospirillum soli]